MFPTAYQASAQPATGRQGRWIGAVTYCYGDGSLLQEVVPDGPASPSPRTFDTPADALQAAEAWGAVHRLSDHTERLTGTYGGES